MTAARRKRGSTLRRDERGLKQCIGCVEWLPEARFWKSPTAMDGLKSRCNRCLNLRSFYKLEYHQFMAMVASQGYCCKLCSDRLDLSSQRKYNIDHDHKCCPRAITCGKCIRSILCSNCNTSLGRFNDDPALLRKAARYVELGGSI
ncbi:endonuclease VII [Mycobacterium phage Bromden]|uniref:Endonuclease VII n=1 Tax=Mycobacterium phage Bromden TaxID=2283252 RepID=A0A345MBJ6_9CAUD|nr:endonuclease VII [Mycobacterium phage Bromden]AXH67867.1 endonuclease VII [Mycobacterium phage Bromden]